jgi:hypothetical protein
MSLQRLALIAEFGWLVAAIGAHGAVLAYCLADHAAGATALGNFTAEILRLVQLSTLPAWLILGPGPKRIRWVAVPLFAALLYAWSGLPYPTASNQAYWLGLEMAGGILLLAIVGRIVGNRIRHLLPGETPQPIQFSIRGLLLTTTAAALLVTTGKWVYSHVQAVATDTEPSLMDLDPLIARTALAAGLAFISLAAWWAVFRPRRVWLACGIVAAASCGCGMLMTLLLHEEYAWLSFGVWWLLHSLAIMATLAPLRQLGFQMRGASQTAAAATLAKSKTLDHKHVSRLPFQEAAT